MKLARNLAAPYEDILHNSGITLVQELIMEDDNYFELELDVQMEKLIEKAKLKATSLTVNEGVIDNIMGDKTPASSLVGSVGGLTGMIEIVKAVSSGIYDLDAAVALVVQRFGLTEEEARKQLGNPKKIISDEEATKVAKLT